MKPGQIYGLSHLRPIRSRTVAFASMQRSCFSILMAALSSFQKSTIATQPDGRDNAATAMKSVVADPNAYDWEGDAPLRRPSSRTIIYEMHVRGFTAHPSSGVTESKRGTYAGLIEKIPYLQDLGITAVELLPVFQFDAQDAPLGRRITGATSRFPSLRRIRRIARARIRLVRSTNSGIWSRRSTAQVSR